jgi:glycosyltransferase involved in cell wall biosynthesis
VEEGVTGQLVSARDEAVLAARLESLVKDGERRRRMGEAARARALSYSWETIMSGLLDSYRRVLREADGR